MASSLSLLTTTLTLAHQRSRSIALSPTNSSSPNTDRTVLRNLRSLAERTSQKPRPDDEERQELDQSLIRLVDLLQKDPKGRQMVDEVRQSHPNFATLPIDESESQESFDPTKSSGSNPDEPYRDNPTLDSQSPESQLGDSELLESQKQIFQQQDSHLDNLSLSIGRQRDLSIQMNDELELQAGLLDELDGDVENTGMRLGRASSRLTRVENSLREHGSTWTILLLIIILVVLISIFK